MKNECPLKTDFNHAAFLGKELARAMRKIKRRMSACDACEFLDDCRIRIEFNATVDGIILEVTEEWAEIAVRAKL